MIDYYKTLGLEQDASIDEIKKAYRKLSRKFHPDNNNEDPFFENLFEDIQEAYKILENIDSRTEYNKKFNEQNTRLKAQKTQSNFEPVIEYFKSNKTLFYSKDEIKFEWKTYNADLIEIKPFGVVEASGNKIFKLNTINKQYLNVEIKATNTNISKTVSKKLILENKTLKKAQSKSTFKNDFSSAYQQKSFQQDIAPKKESFFSIHGRLRRKNYLLRLLLLSMISLISTVIPEILENENLIIFSVITILICAILIAIQAIKRLHDLNKSGWWYLFILVPFVNIVFAFYIIFAPGTEGTNIYGLDSKKN